ncbi:hypothetical protein [Staphylococcus delphini]|uniref:Genomic island nu Sa alpha2 n=1 Tax=Staphylococcus delphini TaxID=53344 RepID=A0AAX0QR15_9STAP|nr:hypothetical protein [Staphylococcus delphini]NBK47591.1 hypothetical protein [Staphylococcus delphini]PCF46740.1 hypothetical protein B5C07_12135 [Staphylococcus delphini]PNZ95678.1 hypothetical protein CD148_03090 [Staphylococcus delphini]RIZ56313.1 hypothetical protein CDL68_01875 [Staphylococcus delphini]VED62554.1 Genomic island nu Sa alpha2 [Staphylococcus delphini]
MNSITIILDLLPTKLQRMLVNKDLDNVLTYFMSNDILDEKLAYYLSSLANQINAIEYHEMVANIYHFHFNYVESAYNLAYYHYWQSLEASQFKDQNLLKEFLELRDEPDFDMITKENIKMVANKVLEKEPENDLAIKYAKS